MKNKFNKDLYFEKGMRLKMEKDEVLGEAVEYFKSNKGFKRMMEKIKNKYISFDRETPGNIIIENPSKEEKDAISGFMKKDYSRNKSITISLKRFQERLDETRFEGTTLKELIEKYFGQEIITQKKEKQQKEEEFNNYLDKIIYEFDDTTAGKILKKIKEEKSEDYKMLKNKYDIELLNNTNFINSEKGEKLRKSIEDVCNSINNLPDGKEKIRLPIFATKTMNNPHGLDRKNLTGKLFINFLIEMEESKKNINYDKMKNLIRNSEELSELYYRHNLMIDDVSNMVLCKNIIGCQERIEHEGWKGFFDKNEAMQVTLDNLSKIDSVKVQYNYVIVVENPAVFMLIAQKIQDKKIPLVCTYGQVKLSGIVLLKMLSQVCKKIYYSGDTDPEGIQIADKIKSRFSDVVELIGFDVDTYYKTLSNICVSDERLKKLEHIENLELNDIVNAVRKEKRVAYEEMKVNFI